MPYEKLFTERLTAFFYDEKNLFTPPLLPLGNGDIIFGFDFC